MECAPTTFLCPLAASFRNSSTLDYGAVESHHGVAMVAHVQNQVLAHDCQADQCDVCRLFHDVVLLEESGRDCRMTGKRTVIPDVNLPYNMRSRACQNRTGSRFTGSGRGRTAVLLHGEFETAGPVGQRGPR